MERIKAKDRQGERTDLSLSNDIPKNSAESETRQIVADKSGFGSHDTYNKAKSLVKKLTKVEELMIQLLIYLE